MTLVVTQYEVNLRFSKGGWDSAAYERSHLYQIWYNREYFCDLYALLSSQYVLTPFCVSGILTNVELWVTSKSKKLLKFPNSCAIKAWRFNQNSTPPLYSAYLILYESICLGALSRNCILWHFSPFHHHSLVRKFIVCRQISQPN